MKSLHVALIALAAFTLAGCAARSTSKLDPGIAALPAHSNPVCFVPQLLPPGLVEQTLGPVKASKRWYGAMGEVLTALADEARKMGAHAVIGFDSRRDVGGFAWARPVADGKAVTLKNPAEFDCAAYAGRLY